jgi:DNA-binding LytR/AlgR family response regulator
MSARALIAEDEAHVAVDLRARLTELWPELEILGIAPNGPEALARIEAEKPDIAFLDIKMPGMSGLEVVQQLRHPCLFVFVTAYDQFAVEAFERAAVDYLVKPVSDERLAKTIGRLREAVKQSAPPDITTLVASLQSALGMPAAGERLKWIKASLGDKLRLVAIEEICYFQSADKYTSVYTRDAQLLIRTPIKDLIHKLDPEQFWQIHRGTVVNARQVLMASTDTDGHVTLKLRDRPEVLPVSRSFAHLFKQM